MKKAVLGFLLLCTTIIVAPLATLAQTDDFDDGDDVGWTRYDPIGVGSWSVTNGGYRLQTAPSPAPGVIGPGRAGSLRNDVIYTNFLVSVDITNWDDTLHQAFGILARITDPAPGVTKGYAFTYDRGTTATSGDMDISRISGEVPSGIDVSGEDNIHLMPGRTYRFEFIGIGGTLEGRVYEHPNLTNPVVRMVGTDPNPFESGVCGLVVYDSSASGMSTTDATFDNYSATVPPPPPPPPLPQLAIVRTTDVEGVIVCWPTNAVGFVLQLTDDLSRPTPSWNDITEGIFVNQETGRYEYFEFTSSANQLFFRLRKPPE